MYPRPICPQESGSAEDGLFAVPPEFRSTERLRSDELECLNLVVTVPKGAPGTAGTGVGGRGVLLPVFVNIHGGANKSGTSAEKVFGMLDC